MRLCTVFLTREAGGFGWPYLGHDDAKNADSIAGRLRDRFPDIEFTSNMLVTRKDHSEIWEIKNEIDRSDGLLVFVIGNPTFVDVGVEFIEVGKPTILANYIYGGDQGFIRIYERVSGRGLRVLPVSSTDFADVERAVELLKGLISLRGKKILIFTFDLPEVSRGEEELRRISDLLGSGLDELDEGTMKSIAPLVAERKLRIDVHGSDQAVQWRRNETKYRENLRKTFGLEMVRPTPDELRAYFEKVDEIEAARIAEKWINNAKEVNASRHVIHNSAKLYLALKQFMKYADCDAVGIECYPVLVSGRLSAFPCLAFFELNNEGSTAVCEADMDSCVSMLLGRYVAGRPGHVSNYSLDTSHDRATYLHCVAPNKPYGPSGPTLGYSISPHGEAHSVGASPEVEFPSGEDITTIKVSVFAGKMLLRHGKSLGSVKDEKACRDKLLVETNARTILERHDHDTFGWHTVSFLGDLREDFIAAAKLLGLEIVEEDR